MTISANVYDQGCPSLQPLERGDDRLVAESAAVPLGGGTRLGSRLRAPSCSPSGVGVVRHDANGRITIIPLYGRVDELIGQCGWRIRDDGRVRGYRAMECAELTEIIGIDLRSFGEIANIGSAENRESNRNCRDKRADGERTRHCRDATREEAIERQDRFSKKQREPDCRLIQVP